MKHLWIALAALATLASAASAQMTEYGRMSVSMGGFAPSDHDTRADDTSTWFRIGLQYRLGERRAAASPCLFAELAAQQGRLLSDPGELVEVRRQRSIAGVGMGIDSTVRVPGTGLRLDAGAGAGLFFLEVANHYDLGEGDEGISRALARRTNPGLRFRAALRDRRGFFVEATQLVVGSLHGLRYDGVSIALGGRF